MWTLIFGLIVTAFVAWGVYSAVRPHRRSGWISPDTMRTRVEGSMITGKDWGSRPDGRP